MKNNKECFDVYAFICRDDEEETGPILFIEYRDNESKKWLQTWYNNRGICLGDGDYFTEVDQTPDQINQDFKKQNVKGNIGINYLIKLFKEKGSI